MFQISKSVANGLMTVGLCATLSTTALAAGNGGSPNGKPFIAIDNQIIEVNAGLIDLQSQIDTLIGVVGTIEERIAASEMAIAGVATWW